MWIDVRHNLHFEYDGFIRESRMELRMQPRSSRHQTLQSFQLTVGPRAPVTRYTDWNENFVHYFGASGYHDRIEVVARSIVDVRPDHPSLESLVEPPAPAPHSLRDFAVLGGPVRPSAALEALQREIPTGARAPLGEQISAIGNVLFERFQYRPGVTNSRSTTDDVLAHRSGVCQDFAHLMLGLLRLRGIACRYVSGYLHVEREGGEPSQSHAWVEVHAPGTGWVGFDPTHAQVPNEHYVVVGHGRHYDDVPPNRGVYAGTARERLRVEVHTATRPPEDAVGWQASIEEIDVPVYGERPGWTRRDPTGVPEQDAGPAPRQQQQQQ